MAGVPTSLNTHIQVWSGIPGSKGRHYNLDASRGSVARLELDGVGAPTTPTPTAGWPKQPYLGLPAPAGEPPCTRQREQGHWTLERGGEGRGTHQNVCWIRPSAVAHRVLPRGATPHSCLPSTGIQRRASVPGHGGEGYYPATD